MCAEQLEFPISGTDFIAISLQSGSNGNCYFIQTGPTKLIIDAGISGIQAKQRLATHHININDVEHLFVSHEHGDHTRSAGIFHRKFGHQLHMSTSTYEVLAQRNRLGKVANVQLFQSGEKIQIHDTTIHTIPTPHDGVDSVGFVIEYKNRKLGILTDLGHVFHGLMSVVCGLDAVFLESNYDVEMLANGPYPFVLKKRISQKGGHISNKEAAHLLKNAFAHKLKWAVLSHLSEQNNSPKIALETHYKVLGKDKPIFVANRYDVSQIFHC